MIPSPTQQSLLAYNCLQTDLWEVCDSYLQRSEVLDFWAALGNPEKGFERLSKTIYQLFKEKVNSLPAVHPHADWFNLRRLLKTNVLGWRSVPSTQRVIGTMVNKIGLTRERLPSPSAHYFQYYVLTFSEKSDKVINKTPLGEPQTHQNGIVELPSNEFAMVPQCADKWHPDIGVDGEITVWRLKQSETPDKSDYYECIARSLGLDSPLSMRYLHSKNQLICSLKDRWILVFDAHLKMLLKFQAEETAESLVVLPDDRFLTIGDKTICAWSLRKSEQSLNAVLEKTIVRVKQRHYCNVIAMQDGRIVTGINGSGITYLCLWDISLPGKAVSKEIYPLNPNETIWCISILATGHIACVIYDDKLRINFIKIWPLNLDPSNPPRIVLYQDKQSEISRFSDAGFTYLSTEGLKIAQPVLDDTFFSEQHEKEGRFCRIL